MTTPIIRIAAPDIGDLHVLRDAALSRTPVSIGPRRTASPHEYYRYPARFAPEFARAAIIAFSNPGDVVSDPFVGGGTTLVEARVAGRLSYGADLNALATFVSRVKTRLYSADDLAAVTSWAAQSASNPGSHLSWPADEQAVPYFRNFSDPALAAQRQVLFAGLAGLASMPTGKATDFARCVLLRTAQWGMDMRGEIPSAGELAQALVENAATTCQAAREATRRYRSADQRVSAVGLPRCLVLDQGLPGVARHSALARHPAPRLVLTSPPYPGVYVNYHRWKVRGRLETPLPYFIAGQSDGHGIGHYTMAARSDRTQASYFARLEAAFRDVAALCDAQTWVVQMVGFNDVDNQLHRYLATMHRAGFSEVTFGHLATDADGRLWRDVPGRRWWARAGGRSEIVQHTAREVVLIHRLRP
ncbi:MAG TPA: DNA methyltransferase [Mycobacteriales bacterium]|jgi:hypothetical protein|nr:DNA methyltransferase [Mycobacteriales bacterium]